MVLYSTATNATQVSHKYPFTEQFFSAKGMKPDPKKVQALQDLPTPQTQKELQSFLGLVNYLCYVRQYHLTCALLLKFSRGFVSCILLFIGCTVIHNCSSSGSLVFATLRQNIRDNVTSISTVMALY